MVFDNRSDKFLKSEFLNGKEKRRESISYSLEYD